MNIIIKRIYKMLLCSSSSRGWGYVIDDAWEYDVVKIAKRWIEEEINE